MTTTASKSAGSGARRVIAFVLLALVAVTVAVLAAVPPGPGSAPARKAR